MKKFKKLQAMSIADPSRILAKWVCFFMELYQYSKLSFNIFKLNRFYNILFASALVIFNAQLSSMGVELRVTLLGALFPGDAPVIDGPSLVLEVNHENDHWSRVWGFAGDFHINAPHPGRIDEGMISQDKISFTVALDIQSGSWAKGGRARYKVELKRQNEYKSGSIKGRETSFQSDGDLPITEAAGFTGDSEGVFIGSFTGEFRGVPVSGKAIAQLKPTRKPPIEFVPLKSGEHPRLLFRRSELETLRQKSQTPFGKAALDKIGWSNQKETDVVGLGLKYQLTGDRKFAEQAIPGIEQLMRGGLHCDQYGNNVGARAQKMALAFDLCYDAWPENFKQRIRRYFLFVADNVWHHQRKMNQGINWHLCSNWSVPIYAGIGICGLALFGEPGPEPSMPPQPNCGVDILPATGYHPSKGVPVVKFQNDEMPGDWLCASPFPLWEPGDPLAEIGGVTQARPEPGTKISFAGHSEVFRFLTHTTNGGYWSHPTYTHGKEALDITLCSRRVNFNQSYFFTVISNDSPRWIRIATDYGSATVYLNGIALKDGEAAHLSEGLYPMMVHATLDWCNEWGHVWMQPRLIEISAAEAKAITAERQSLYEQQLRDWDFDVSEWKRLGGVDIESQKLFEGSRLVMKMLVENAIGVGGFQAEVAHYGNIASKAALGYAAPYWRMFGMDLTPECDFECFLPRKIFAHAYGSDGQALSQEINGTPAIDLEMFAAAFPVVPEKWKPAVLWAWNWHAEFGEGINRQSQTSSKESKKHEEARKLTNQRQSDRKTGESYDLLLSGNPVLTFINYPLDLKPQPPKGILPLTWQAPTFGYYGFRNTWDGIDDFIVQVFLKARHIGGWNGHNAGTFRVLGLGEIWAYGPTDRSRSRWEECVVWLPEDEINTSACARLTYARFEPDGSGVVSFDMSDVYAGANKDENGRVRLYERYGGLRRPSAFADSGITGMRSIAVDYSGKSGAPCLIAIGDKISGGKSKVWVWQLGQAAGKNSMNDLARTKVEGNTFTITKGDATLHGTFVLPKNVKLSAEIRQKSMIGGAASVAGKVLERPIAGVFAEGGDEFFVVVTIQRGPPPEVRIAGDQAFVGARRIYFSDQKISVE
jgi:hypothetical protein